MRAWCILSVLFVFLAGCGGGGSSNGSSSNVPLPANATVQFVIGAGQALQVRRRRNYLSPNAQSAIILEGNQSYTVALEDGAPGCTGLGGARTCSISFTSPTGLQTFTIKTYTGPFGSGSVLSQTTIAQNVGAGVTTIRGTLDGVPARVALPVIVSLPSAKATSVPLAVNVYDATDNLIVGPGNYTSPVSLTDSDTTGDTVLSSTSIGGPGQPLSISYNGKPDVNGTITASIGSTMTTAGSGQGQLRIAANFTEFGTPVSTGVDSITPASDGSMWAISSGTAGIGWQPITLTRISPTGTMTNFTMDRSLPLGTGVAFAAMSPDSRIWATENTNMSGGDAVSQFDMLGRAVVHTNASLKHPGPITLGPDGNMWFVQWGGTVANVSPVTAAFTFYTYPQKMANGGTASFTDITAGPDNNLWATEATQGGLMQITTSGQMTFYPLPAAPGSAWGPAASTLVTQNGHLWVDAPGPAGGATIFEMDTSGHVLSQQNLTSGGSRIFAAPDGSLWVPEFFDYFGSTVIDRVTETGVSKLMVANPQSSYPGSPTIWNLVPAPDGSMWYLRNMFVGKISLQ